MKHHSGGRLSGYGLCLLLSLLYGAGACGGPGSDSTSPNAGLPEWERPADVPDSAYWYFIHDTVFWYDANDSLALAQMRPGTTPEQKSRSLFALRELGWRMKVERGPGLNRPGDAQGLDQQVFMLERAEHAASLSGEPRVEALYRRTADGERPALAAVLPGLRLYDKGSVQYFWPAVVAIVWSPRITAQEANALLDSLDCVNLTSSQLTYQYFVQRGWSVTLPAGADLFAWLRMFNGDPRVQIAHPVTSLRDPPAADYRLIRRVQGKPIPDPEGFYKLSEKLKNAYYLAHFSGVASQVPNAFQIAVEGDRFKLQITTGHTDAEADSLLVTSLGGEPLERSRSRIAAWLPYSSIPALAADSTVKRVVEIRAGM